MHSKTVWKEKMAFVGESHEQLVRLDATAPIGDGAGITPKELLTIAVSSCTAMDVAALMKKHKQPLETFEVAAEAEIKEGSKPQIFAKIELTFSLTGALDRERVLEAVHLSQTKYCGVSAMVAKAVPITYKVVLNGEPIGEGKADFE